MLIACAAAASAFDRSGLFHARAHTPSRASAADGNLVLYNKNGKALWASGTNSVGDRLEVQKDGNLVVYQDKRVKWASNTHSNPKGCELVVQDDCNLVLYKSNRNSKVYGVDNALGNFQPKDAIWSSGTFGHCNDPLFK